MPTLTGREAVANTRPADRVVDPAELIFDDIMAQPLARRTDRAPGAEAAPVGYQTPEALIFVNYMVYFAAWGGRGGTP